MQRIASWGPYLVFGAAMLWATDAPFRVYLTEGLSSSFIVLAEHLVSFIIVLPLLVLNWRVIRALTFKQWAAVLTIAIAGSALATVAFTEAFRYVNPSVAILLQKLQPLIAITLSAIFLREKLSPQFFALALLALGGAYLISFPNLVPQTYPGEVLDVSVIGVGLALCAALFWAASTVLGRFMLDTVDFKVMTALRMSIAFVFLLILAGAQGTLGEVTSLTGTDMWFIVIIALVSGVASMFLYYKGLSATRASVATLAELGFPVAAVIVNWIFLDAALSPVQLLGTAVLLFAVYRLASYNRATW